MLCLRRKFYSNNKSKRNRTLRPRCHREEICPSSSPPSSLLRAARLKFFPPDPGEYIMEEEEEEEKKWSNFNGNKSIPVCTKNVFNKVFYLLYISSILRKTFLGKKEVKVVAQFFLNIIFKKYATFASIDLKKLNS